MNSRIKFALMLLSVVLLLCSCGSPKNIDTLPPAVESETESGLSTEHETEITAEETNNNTPPETDYEAELAIPDINLDEIVWYPYLVAKVAISGRWFQIDYWDVPPDAPVSIDTLDDEKWYGVDIDLFGGYLFPMDPNEKSYWIDGIDEDGKLTYLINDYISKYNACIDYCKTFPVDEINDVMKSDEYLELHNKAATAKKSWQEYCENFYKVTKTKLWEELENETDYFAKLNLRRTIDMNENASKKINNAFIIDNNFEMRMRLLGLYDYGTITGKDRMGGIYVAKIKDIKKIEESISSFEIIQVYWASYHYAEEEN